MKIIVDTREKVGKNKHILDYFDKQGIEWERRKLDYGDYTIEGLEDKIVIERKCSLDELALNFTRGRDRFKREFQRAADNGAKIVVMVERADYGRIVTHRYRSKFIPKAYIASIESFKEDYGADFVFLPRPKVQAGKFILETLRGYI